MPPLAFDTFEESLLLELDTAEEPSDDTAIMDNKKFAAEDETSDLWLVVDSEHVIALK